MCLSTHIQVIKITSTGRVFVDSVESQLPLFKCEWPHVVLNSKKKGFPLHQSPSAVYLLIFDYESSRNAIRMQHMTNTVWTISITNF